MFLLLQSWYSYLAANRSPNDLVMEAVRNGYETLILADTTGLAGAPEFLAACANYGITPGLGCTILGSDGHEHYLIADNRFGLRRINEIVTRATANRDRKTGGGRIEKYQERAGHRFYPGAEGCIDWLADLENNGTEGLIVIAGSCRLAARLRKVSSSNLFCSAEPVYASLRSSSCFRGIGLTGMDAPVIAAPKANAISRDDVFTSELLKHMSESRSNSIGPLCIRRIEDLATVATRYRGTPEALTENYRLSRRIDASEFLPRRPVFPGFPGLDDEGSIALLSKICRSGVSKRYGRSSDRIERRLKRELDLIGQKRFASYFLAVYDIVKRFPRTCGRGSGAASVVSYLLGITHVDPIKFDLSFDRFLSEVRTDPPDIDVDFPWDERHDAIDYLLRRYEGRIGVVCDHVRFGDRSSIREAAKLLGYRTDRIDEMVDLGVSNTGSLSPRLDRISRLIRGIPDHAGTHPGGVVIVPESMLDYCSVSPSDLGYPLICWDKAGVESGGLVKIDLLGNRSLAVLRDCIRLVSKRGVEFEWDDNRGLSDPETRRLFRTGDTVGVFYTESPATRQLLSKMGRGGYEEVVAATSIIRPAARSAIVTYLERLHTGMWERLDHRYENALAETRGVLVYQEDVAKAATAVAGFGAAEADRLRRIVCLKEPVSTLEEYRIRFHTGAARRGFDSLTTTSVWRMIEEFSGYSFCKAHSASYALVAFRLAWMKVHFPEVFFPSVINNGGGYYRRQFYLDEARRSGLGILRPDVTVSRGRYVAEGSGMRVGLTQIAGVTEHLASRIVRERGRSRFVDVEDFIGRVVPADAALRNLVHAGALDSLSSGTRRRIRWQCFAIGAQRSLFADSPVLLDVEHSAKTLVRHEVESTGLFISDHPIEMLRPAIDLWRRRNAIEVVEPIQRLVAHKAGWRKPAPPEPGVTLVGCPVAIKEVAMRSGEVMCFASFEDETGVVETVLSPAVYRTSRRVLLRGYIIAIRGEVSYEWQTPMITVRELDLIV